MLSLALKVAALLCPQKKEVSEKEEEKFGLRGTFKAVALSGSMQNTSFLSVFLIKTWKGSSKKGRLNPILNPQGLMK